jgi:phytoene desaturase
LSTLNGSKKMSKKVVVIGSGFGGLAIAIRLQNQGFDVSVYEKRDKLGGRAYVIKDQGFTWDCGPTILTAPYLLTELFELCGEKIEDHLKIVPLFPYYRIYFHDKTFFDYSADLEHQLKEVEKLSPVDKQGYLNFVKSINKLLHPFGIW